MVVVCDAKQGMRDPGMTWSLLLCSPSSHSSLLLNNALFMIYGIWFGICHSFGLNLLLYQRLHSQTLCDVLGSVSGTGAYKPVSRWLNTYSECNEPILDTKNDVCIGVDNEQKLGRSYTSSVHSNLENSCICVVIAFSLQLDHAFQSNADGLSSKWRYPEICLDESDKRKVLSSAMHGRETGILFSSYNTFRANPTKTGG